MIDELNLTGSLSQEAAEAVVNHLISSGNGEWDDPQKRSRFRVYLKRPEEWAGIIYDYVCQYDMFRNVYTVYELHSGDISVGARKWRYKQLTE